MNKIADPTIRFSHAVAALGVTPKTLRNWLTRGQVELDGDSTGWRTFSVLDLAKLAITSELVRYGMGVSIANTAANDAVNMFTHVIRSYRNTPIEVITAPFKDCVIFAHNTGENWTFMLLRPQDSEQEWPHGSTLVVKLQPLLERMMRRLRVALLDGEDDAS